MRRFVLERHRDVSGVSGTGRVVEGVCFTDGTVAMRWVGGHASTVVYGSVDDVVSVHGHDGATRLTWIDE